MILQCIAPSATLLKIPTSRAQTSPIHRRSILTNLATTCRPRGVSQISTVVSQRMPIDGDDVKGGFFEVELKVRDYELDQFWVIHHAVYINYCQQGRHELLEKIGINIDAIAGSGYALTVTELSFKYIDPLRRRDKFVLKVRLTDSSSVRLFFEHRIYKLPNHEIYLHDAHCSRSYTLLDYKTEKSRDDNMKEVVIFMAQQCYAVAAPISSALMFYPASDTPEFVNCVQEQQRKLTLALLDKAKEVCANQGVDAETVTEVGDPKEAICSVVKKFDIRLLVMGEHGLGKIKRALVGSVSNYCIQKAKCPVLVVKKSQCA